MSDHKGHHFSGEQAKKQQRKNRRYQKALLNTAKHLKKDRQRMVRMLSKSQRDRNKKARRVMKKLEEQAIATSFADVWPA